MRLRNIWLLSLPLLVTACSASDGTFLLPQGPVASAQQALFYKVIGLMLIVVLPVFIFTPWFAWRYRRGRAAGAYRPKWEFSWVLELLIWGLPFLIVILLAVNLWNKTSELDPYRPLGGPVTPLEVQVVGLDWKWLFIYPEQDIATVNELVFPARRPLHLSLTTDSVMQSFFIPALGSQIYAMAGMNTQLHLQADSVGNFTGENTQYNGSGFHKQKFIARSVPSADFDAWVKRTRRSASTLDNDVYGTLETKSLIEEPVRYGHVEGDLYHRILQKYRYGSKHEASAKQKGGSK